MTVLAFVARRLLQLASVLLVVCFLVFSLLSLSPGSPEQTLLGPEGMRNADAVAAVRAQYHLDESVITRFWHWLLDAVRFDFGRSMRSGQPVMSVIAERFPVTAQLAVAALLIVVVIGVPAGMLAAAWRGRTGDQVITSVAILATSAPAFAVGVLLIYVFGVELGWFPVFGVGTGVLDRAHHLALPAVATAMAQVAIVVRQTRASSLNVMQQDYMTFARARGLSRPRIVLSYALRNASLPVVTTVGLMLAVGLSGAVLVEVTFALPGMGTLMVESVRARDIAVVQGLTLCAATFVVLVNLLVDIVILAIDPRARYAGGAT